MLQLGQGRVQLAVVHEDFLDHAVGGQELLQGLGRGQVGGGLRSSHQLQVGPELAQAGNRADVVGVGVGQGQIADALGREAQAGHLPGDQPGGGRGPALEHKARLAQGEIDRELGGAELV